MFPERSVFIEPNLVTVMKLSSLFSSVRRWRHYRDTVQELSRLSDRELDDIGISRSEISRIARRSLVADL